MFYDKRQTTKDKRQVYDKGQIDRWKRIVTRFKSKLVKVI